MPLYIKLMTMDAVIIKIEMVTSKTNKLYDIRDTILFLTCMKYDISIVSSHMCSSSHQVVCAKI